MDLSQFANKTHNEMELLEQLLSLDGMTILELGCGAAEITRGIATAGTGRTVIATEVDQIQHKKNQAITDLPNTSFLLAGAEEIPLADNSVDIVLMFKSLHHVPVELMENAFSEIKRVLKKGGMVYISEPIFAGDFNEVLRLFHDEEEVRKAAYHAIQQTIEKKQLTAIGELFFDIRNFFESFEVFDKKVINSSHGNHNVPAELYQQVKEKFAQYMGKNGAEFLMPMRVNILQK